MGTSEAIVGAGPALVRVTPAQYLYADHWLTRTEWLLGAEAIKQLKKSRILVAGLGGVGAYAAEMLARAGVGHLTLVDSDFISLTNRNRQLLALESTTGKWKTEVMAARLRDINPQIEVEQLTTYIDESTAHDVVSGRPLHFMVDAIDTLSPKIALIQAAIKQGIPLVSSMGAGAKRDATMVRLSDISKSYNCPLAFMLRKRLRKLGITKGFEAVFSIELPHPEAIIPCEERNKKSQVGTISYLPAIFGCVCAQAAIDRLLLEVSQK